MTNRDVIFYSVVGLWFLIGFGGGAILKPSPVFWMGIVNGSAISIMIIFVICQKTIPRFNDWLNKSVKKEKGKSFSDKLKEKTEDKIEFELSKTMSLKDAYDCLSEKHEALLNRVIKNEKFIIDDLNSRGFLWSLFNIKYREKVVAHMTSILEEEKESELKILKKYGIEKKSSLKAYYIIGDY